MKHIMMVRKGTGHRGRKLRSMGIFLVMVLFIGLLAGTTSSKAAPDTSGTLTNENTVYYPAKISVNSKANVRTGPGTSNDVLMLDGEKVQLTNGHDVLILAEEKDTDGDAWYRIRFTYKEKQLEGYCLASFMVKTGESITPTPLPTPSPTPTPTPSPTPSPAPTNGADKVTPGPSKTPTKAPTQNPGGGNILVKVLLVVFVILFVLAAAYIAYYFLVYKKQKEEQRMRQRQQNSKPVAHKRTGESGERKSMRPESGGPGRTTGQVKPAQTGTKTTGFRPNNGQMKKPGSKPLGTKPMGVPKEKPAAVAPEQKVSSIPAPEVTTAPNLFATEKPEPVMDDRSALRDEINGLEAGDYAMHKYLGIGQVYDNSDVKLIEIRFGSDMRFLNKESCILKKILRKCREDEI